MILRTYQQQAVDGVVRTLNRVGSCLVVAPTGTGKTPIIAEIVKLAAKGRVLVLAHREELIVQLAGTIRATGLEVGIEMADWHAEERWWDRPQVVVATVQTLTATNCHRLYELVDQPDDWSITIIDEAHHAPADTYRKIIDHMGNNDNHRLVGFTATPSRADDIALGSIFEEVAFEYTIRDAMADGYLVPPRMKYVQVESLTYEHVRTTCGELNGADLAKVMEDERNVHAMAVPMFEVATSPWNVVFCSTVAQAEEITMVLNRLEPDCARVVSAGTPKDLRRRLFQEFDAGDFRFLVNCAICTEGWDCPQVRMVVCCSPTKSWGKYVQQIGRGLRPLPDTVELVDSPGMRRAAIANSDKSSCIILDFAGNCGRHKLANVVDVLGGRWPEETRRRADEILREGTTDDIDEALVEADQQLRLEAERRKRDEIAKREKLTAQVKYATRDYDPFDILDIDVPRQASDEPASTKQVEFLLKWGLDASSMTKKQATRIQREIFRRKKLGLCSIKQARWLKKHGLSTELTKEAASIELDRIFR